VARDLTLGVETKGAAEAGKSIYVLGRAFDDLGDEMAGAANDARKLNGDLAKLEVQTAAAGKTARALSGAIDDLGDQTKDAATAAIKAGVAYRDLDGKLRDARGRFLSAAGAARLLAHEVDDVGDQARQASRTMDRVGGFRPIASLRKLIQGLGNDTERFDKILGATLGKIPDLLSNIPGLGALGGLAGNPAAGAVAAPVVAGGVITAGAAAGGLTTAGIGAGVAAAGVAGAAIQSQKVRDEWSKTTAAIKAQFLDATTSFEGPTINATRRVNAAFHDIDMKKIFGDAAKFVEPLSDATAKAVGSLGRGIEAAVSKGGPAIRATSDLIADLGDASGHALETIAGGSEGGAKAIRDLDGALSATIEDIGYFVRGTEDVYNALDSLRRKAAEVHPFIGAIYDVKGTDFVSTLGATELGLRKAEAAARGVSDAFTDMTSQASIANQTFANLFGITMNLDEANLRVKTGMDDLRKAAHDTSVSHDEITQKVLGEIGALEAQREAQLATGDGSQAATDKINAGYNAQLEQLKKMFPWLDALISKYEDLAKPLTKHIDIIIQEKRIGSVSVEGVISGGDQRRNTGRGYASGTRNAPPGLAWVGEAGRPELVDFHGGERVYNPSESSALMRGWTEPASPMRFAAMAGAGGSPSRMAVDINFSGVSAGNDVDAALAGWFMKQVRIGGITIDAKAVR
jgi:hypothetical protein